ncbi:TadE/TadG family type IV pilus assembly protein [Rhizobium sp. WL3]|uniref:vWA domain-containing protein n=1 Tax=Rhizobium sp. WL3 TaxID=2603277 RepID=UPI001AED4E13|nr:TadE/TadG family type IV pilus assembly protein [Rhizobium sp. WL3]
MMTKPDSKIKSIFSRFCRDRAGNFGIATAVIIPVVAATAGVALDYNRMVQVRVALQDSADSAVLSAANALAKNNTMSDEEVLEFARKFMKAQFTNVVPGAGNDETEETPEEDPLAGAVGNVERALGTSGKSVKVTLTPKYTMPTNGMTALLGWKEVTVGVTATAESTPESGAALSMYLVLDRSGSMSFTTDSVDTSVASCVNYSASNWAYKDVQSGRNYIKPTKPCYVKKIQALKTASAIMMNELVKADPKTELARVGAVSYNDSTQSPSGMAWGVTTASNYISALPLVPTGGTDASGGMEAAFNALKKDNNAEKIAHSAKGNSDFTRYIVLMTDGEMTGYSSSWNSSIDAEVLSYCTAAKNDGIQVFTVAFMAPQRGKALLSACASSLSNYYEPQTMSDLVDDFGEIGKAAAKASTRLTN